MNINFVDRDMTFIARPRDHGGYTWTLTSLFGHFLSEAEARYGDRDKAWTPLGVEFGADGPMVWYPDNTTHIVIMLSLEARENADRAVFQLAHEVIHILSPTGRRGAAPNLEEGLATKFSHDMASWCGSNFRSGTEAYSSAEVAVRQLLEFHPEGVKAVRSIEPRFSAITPDLIRSTCPQVPESLANRLCEPFKRGAD